MAARYWVGGGSSTNWNAVGPTNWSDTSGGSNDFSVPTSADDVTFDANGNNNCVIPFGTYNCLTLTITAGYTSTVTFNGDVWVGTNITFNTGWTVAGSGDIVTTNNGVITSNGFKWPNDFIISGTCTKTLVGNLSLTTLELNTGFDLTLNSTTAEILNVDNLKTNANTQFLGNTPVYLKGGTLTVNAGMRNTVYIDGNSTFATGYTIDGGSLTYLSGTLTTPVLRLGGNCTVDVAGVTWDSITTINADKTVTLLSDLNTSGIFSTGGGSADTTIDTSVGAVITCYGLSLVSALLGSAKIIMKGGIWSGSTLGNSIDFDGTCTLDTTVTKRGGTMTFVSGTLTVTNINVAGTITWNLPGIDWNNITMVNNGAPTLNIQHDIYLTGTLTAGNAGGGNLIVNSSGGSYKMEVNGLSLPVRQIQGTMPIYLVGGTWSGGGSLWNNLYFDGNSTISGTVRKEGTSSINYVSGSITTTGSTLVVENGGITFDTNGISWNNITFNMSGVGTYTQTIQTDLTINGLLSLSGNNGDVNLNTSTGSIVYCNGGMAVNRELTGTASIYLQGGTWSGTNTVGLGSNLFINGNITVSGSVYYRTRTLRYLTGTVTVTGSTLVITASCSLNTNGMAWNNMSVSNTATITLISNCLANGVFTASAATTINGAFTLSCSGLTVNNTISGTSKIILLGGTWSGSNTTGVSNNLDLNGNITISGNVYYRTGTLDYLSGTITTTSSTLHLTNGCILDTFGVLWNNVTLTDTTAQTYTINSLLNISNTLTLGTGASTIFAGTSGFTTGTLLCNVTAAASITLREGVTYTINNAFTAYLSRIGAILLFTSSSGSIKANLVMPNNGNNICNVLASFTRIDASGGRSICTFNGTITDCINVISYTDYPTIKGA
jgi:hypothetical protein